MTEQTEPTLEQRLRAPFAPEDYKARVEEGTYKSGPNAGQTYKRTFTYVEDEKVMNRLDDVFSAGNWGITVTPIDRNTVKVRLDVLGMQPMEAIGIAENTDGKEAPKEAVTDGIRRVGSYLGIARDVYEGKVAPGGGQQAAGARNSNAAPTSAQTGTQTPVAAAQQVFGDEARIPQPGDPCPKHPTERLIAGRDATGPDGLYHQDGYKDDGKRKWCTPYRQPRQPRR